MAYKINNNRNYSFFKPIHEIVGNYIPYSGGRSFKIPFFWSSEIVRLGEFNYQILKSFCINKYNVIVFDNKNRLYHIIKEFNNLEECKQYIEILKNRYNQTISTFNNNSNSLPSITARSEAPSDSKISLGSSYSLDSSNSSDSVYSNSSNLNNSSDLDTSLYLYFNSSSHLNVSLVPNAPSDLTYNSTVSHTKSNNEIKYRVISAKESLLNTEIEENERERISFLYGNSEYNNHLLPDLPGVKNDLNAMEHLLKDQYSIYRREDLEYYEFNHEWDNFINEIKEYNSNRNKPVFAVIYIAAHGQSIGGEFEFKDKNNVSFQLKYLIHSMSEVLSGSSKAIFIIDSCRVIGDKIPEPIQFSQQYITNSVGVLFSCDYGDNSFETMKNNVRRGIFTSELIAYISQKYPTLGQLTNDFDYFLEGNYLKHRCKAYINNNLNMIKIKLPPKIEESNEIVFVDLSQSSSSSSHSSLSSSLSSSFL